MCISFDIQLSFIHARRNLKKVQWWYVPVSTLVSFALAAPYLFYGKLWWNNEKKIFGSNWPTHIVLAMNILHSSVIFACIFYSITLILTTLGIVLRRLDNMNKGQTTIKSENRERQRKIIQSVVRLLGYPLVLIICMPAGFVLKILYTMGARATPFGDFTNTANTILGGMQGILNLLIFLFNPALSDALANHRYFAKRWPFKKQNINCHENGTPCFLPKIERPRKPSDIMAQVITDLSSQAHEKSGTHVDDTAKSSILP
ncbi:uncharacterized protein VTP21DRAFT_6894 [Calcarisporiella thermophila]|uniref:uncharacterized protein n=1 Tax=Calcarisporiella thermophila TaxID=911321 RepID=UPI0037440CBD